MSSSWRLTGLRYLATISSNSSYSFVLRAYKLTGEDRTDSQPTSHLFILPGLLVGAVHLELVGSTGVLCSNKLEPHIREQRDKQSSPLN